MKAVRSWLCLAPAAALVCLAAMLPLITALCRLPSDMLSDAGFPASFLVPVFCHFPWLPGLCLLLFLCLNVFPLFPGKRPSTARLRICQGGCVLLRIFLLSTAGTVLLSLASLPVFYQLRGRVWLWSLLTAVLAEGIIFWNGILRVYLTSRQLGLRWRVLGALCGWIPVLNLYMLSKIIRLASQEVAFEEEKLQLNRQRKKAAVCRTKYPLLLVHGVFFRDYKYINYWGRIPGELQKNGAVIYYGNHQSAASVADSAAELARRIREVLKDSGAEKLNIIAHSKGGLDCRFAVSQLGMGAQVASLTTVSTPHRGCLFADYLLSVIPEAAQKKVAETYNRALRRMGDSNPDFMAAVRDLTASACQSRNERLKDDPDVFCQSVGSRLHKASGGQFPLNFSYHLVKHFDGPNDGLVAEDSFPWGERYQCLTTSRARGISHGDMVDLNRENLDGFDVREFYVTLVSQLRERGL